MRTEYPSLRRKLLVWLLLPLLILFFLRAGYTYYYATELANRVYDRSLRALASSLGQQVVYDAARHRFTLPEAAHNILLSDGFNARDFAIRDKDGRITDGEVHMPPSPAHRSNETTPFFDARLNGKNVRVVYLNQNTGEQPFVIEVAETLEERSLLAREFQIGVLIPQLLIILLVTFIVWFGIGKSLAPLRRLQRSVSERSHLDLRSVDEKGIPAEVQPLVQAINDLMARLSKALDAQNRFIADAAHQLRTPLAGLKAQIELALRQDEATLPSQMRLLLSSADRMTRLVNQLLTLARNEPMAENAIRRSRFDLGTLVSDITMEWVPRALEKSIDIGFEPPSDAVILCGDAGRIKDLIDNLIDNAIRYTPAQGQVTVSVIGHPRPQLIVADNGPGIPEEQRDRVFERFYSVLGYGADGSGLGLAIVKEIARMHGAEVGIEDGLMGRGTRIIVTF